MKGLNLPTPQRRLLAWAYLVLAVMAPLMVLLLPGQPPLSVDQQLLIVEDGRFLKHQAALGEGADNYNVDVVSDLSGNVASAAADYPDGSNAMLALFDTHESASAALEALKGMIPHQQEEHDLWARHFASDSGEYVMLAIIDSVLVMIISEREPLARDRLVSLPVLNYNPSPGLGAVLQQQSILFAMLALAFYVVVQWLLVRLLFVWAGIGLSKPEAENKDESDG